MNTVRSELSEIYDLRPSAELAESLSDIYKKMDRVVTPPDFLQAAPYIKAINDLKRERNAVILAHN